MLSAWLLEIGDEIVMRITLSGSQSVAVAVGHQLSILALQSLLLWG